MCVMLYIYDYDGGDDQVISKGNGCVDYGDGNSMMTMKLQNLIPN